MALLKTIILEDDTEKEIPLKWTICGTCEGEGKSSAYLGAYTWDELDDAGEDFVEDYFAGNYDRPCDCCKGAGKVQEPDFDRMTPEDAELYRAQAWELASAEREQANEMRMGA